MSDGARGKDSMLAGLGSGVMDWATRHIDPPFLYPLPSVSQRVTGRSRAMVCYPEVASPWKASRIRAVSRYWGSMYPCAGDWNESVNTKGVSVRAVARQTIGKYY